MSDFEDYSEEAEENYTQPPLRSLVVPGTKYECEFKSCRLSFLVLEN